MKIKELEQNFKNRNIDVLWFNTFCDIKDYLLEQIPTTASVGIGNSKSLKKMDITKYLVDRGSVVFDKALTQADGNEADVIRLKKASLLADCYISSANAVSIDGRIVNIDHSGNSVAAITYGPDKVYIVVGKKIGRAHV